MIARRSAGSTGVPRALLPSRTSEQELHVLVQLAEALAGATRSDEVLEIVSRVARDHFGATFGGAAMLDEGGLNLAFSDAPMSTAGGHHSDELALASEHPAAVATRDGRSLWIGAVDSSVHLDEGFRRSMRAAHVQAVAYLPLFAAMQRVGCLVLLWPMALDFTPADRQLLDAVCGYVGQALHQARLGEQRDSAARILQAALLPVLPSVDWLETYGYYRPADAASEVGGDWYDAFDTAATGTDPDAPERSMTVVIGDVYGHDTQAAAQMGRMQSKLHALAYDNLTPPGRLLERLDHVMNASRATTRPASAVVATITVRDDGVMSVSWSNAGHPPPLVMTRDRNASFLEVEPQLPLGLTDASARTTHHASLPVGSVLLFYTDGLIERSSVPIDDALAALHRAGEHAAAAAPRCLPVLVDRILDHLTQDLPPDDHNDDVALLAVRVR